jgi:hypothetical protein
VGLVCTNPVEKGA